MSLEPETLIWSGLCQIVLFKKLCLRGFQDPKKQTTAPFQLSE